MSVQVAERWKYGDEGQRYAVEVGQVWEVGQHIYVCSDLMDSAVLDEVLDGKTFEVVYCDPPWGQGLANGFRTKAGLPPAEYDWTDIYRRVAAFAHERDVPLWLEGSTVDKATGAPIPDLMSQPGDYRAYFQASYFGSNPYGLYYSGRQMPPEVHITPKLADFAVTQEVLRHYSGTVLDPCGGLGGVQLTAQALGMGSISNELSPYRMSKAMARMVQVCGKIAQRVG